VCAQLYLDNWHPALTLPFTLPHAFAPNRPHTVARPGCVNRRLLAGVVDGIIKVAIDPLFPPSEEEEQADEGPRNCHVGTGFELL